MNMRFNIFLQFRKSQYVKLISLLLIIMSLSLLFARVCAADTQTWAGKWDLSDHDNPPFYSLEFRQTENRVSGTVVRGDENGTLEGDVTGNQLVGTWESVTSGKRLFGSFRFTIESNGQTISGFYIHEEEERKKIYPGKRIWSATKRFELVIKEILFVKKPEPPYEEINEISYGEPFYIEAVFNSPPDEDKKTVLLDWGEGADKQKPIIVEKQDGNPTIFLSDTIYVKRPTS